MQLQIDFGRVVTPTADIIMIMMMGGNFMQGGEIFTALPHFQVMNGMCVTIK